MRDLDPHRRPQPPVGTDSATWAAGPAVPAVGGGPEDADLDIPSPGDRRRALIGAEALVAAAPEALALVDALEITLRARATADPKTPPAIFSLEGVGSAGATLLDQILGHGEVSGLVREADGATVMVQESVLTGVWRLQRRGTDGMCRGRWIEVSAVPDAVVRAAATARPARTVEPEPGSAGLRVAPSLLVEILDRARRYRPDARTPDARRSNKPNHVIALTNLPVTAADLACLRETLGPGPVALHSRGYGTCDIDATGVANVWSVRFLNASGVVILDTLEIGGVPDAARAASEDFADAAVRLADIRDAYL
ncbi:hydrogenase expression/formation protein [Roseospira marina]|uniref:Hydrogenase expression/formation protein n=1 Tax=Roseospira marina TaxID=140057 RepID=A0A5M6IDC2_9PROT|nr:hydrogenase expression/formation protein [Roseospira marina]KAA5606280.1 hydrogenase expression/formation protein [Roseospira marina]MBB4314438.1 hydrogenase-1 operon protein HyaF [Roseospira marina]MBB5087598.1 hydrogenase-1 operon protein HyaF [Roseospira marina]